MHMHTAAGWGTHAAENNRKLAGWFVMHMCMEGNAFVADSACLLPSCFQPLLRCNRRLADMLCPRGRATLLSGLTLYSRGRTADSHNFAELL